MPGDRPRRRAPIGVTLKDVRRAGTDNVKRLACLLLVLLVAGCIPIGARVSNMYAQPEASQPRA